MQPVDVDELREQFREVLHNFWITDTEFRREHVFHDTVEKPLEGVTLTNRLHDGTLPWQR